MAISVATDFAKLVINQDQIVPHINKTCPFLSWVKKELVTGVATIGWTNNFGGSTASMHAEGADASTYDHDTRVHASLGWKSAWATFGVTGLAQSTLQQGNPYAGEDAGLTEMYAHGRELAYLLNGQCITGDGTGNNLTGLETAIGAVTGSYANISRVTYAGWRPYVVDPGSATALTVKQIDDDVTAIKIACGQAPNAVVVHPLTAQKLRLLFNPTMMVGPNVPATAAFGSVGYEKFSVFGLEVIQDPQASVAKILYVNSEHVKLKILNTYTAGQIQAIQEVFSSYPNGSLDPNFQAAPLGFNLARLAKTGDSDKAMLLWKGQLVVDRPQTCGTRLNIQ